MCYLLLDRKGFLNLGIKTNLWEIQRLRNVSQEGALLSRCPFCDRIEKITPGIVLGKTSVVIFQLPLLVGSLMMRQVQHQCLDAGHLLRCHSRVPAENPQQVTDTAFNVRWNWFFESDFDKTLTHLQGLMSFPFWWSPKLPDSERPVRISGFEKQYLLPNTSICFPTRISSQRKCPISPLWVK